jgi:hypothetical protein
LSKHALQENGQGDFDERSPTGWKRVQ